jgi:hypothetical protein
MLARHVLLIDHDIAVRETPDDQLVAIKPVGMSDVRPFNDLDQVHATTLQGREKVGADTSQPTKIPVLS